ncbi:hypothetical protein K1728_12170 (plasmid) [Weissella confusa]|uniref:hypothetical protein n=2 Tax=Weissella confusa TaxID=1583 RepID=UPI001C6FB9B0|nr:hypothetical protein [Weissella confusa]QYU58992.1 hypothetical protein K1728_12170 [Weissella confusa]
MKKNVEYIDGIQVYKDFDGQSIYNPTNDRLLELTKGDASDFLKSSESSFFKHGRPRRRRYFDFVIFGGSIKLSKIKNFLELLDSILSNKAIIYFAAIAQLIALIYITGNVLINVQNFKFYDTHYSINSILTVGLIYLIMTFITMLHEMGHVASYSRELSITEVFLGVEIRYGVMLLFFTSVPFIDKLDSKSQIDVILSGIKSQLVLGLIPLILLPFEQTSFLGYVLFVMNFIYMLLNALPFMKLDGYWAINKWMGVEDYSKELWHSIKNHQYPGNAILALNILNWIMIGILIFASIKEVWQVLS